MTQAEVPERKKKKTFILKYDPNCGPDRMFVDFKLAAEGKLRLVEPHIMKSNSVEALLAGFTEERLQLFQTLGRIRPADLEQLVDYLQRDYEEVRKDVEILINYGVVKLVKRIKPVALYNRLVLELSPGQTFLVTEKNLRELNKTVK